ncbi:MAG: hypothetical protein IJ449_11670 [Clostridia bacterium]|nr:hypothetical protein [Clostridia bacterium]
MRGLDRNKRNFWISHYLENAPIFDGNGKETRETLPIYSDPIQLRASVSVPSDEATRQMFGVNVTYDSVITFFKPFPDVSEEDVLWMEHEPSDGTPHDHIIRRISKSKNVMTVAIVRVNVS